MHWMVSRIDGCDATFQDGRRQASAHYGIEDGTVHQYVKEEDTAWHCGVWEINQETIGIEHSGGPDLPISEETIQTSINLVTDICKRYGIPADRQHIRKHSEVKATQCPGTLPVDRIVEEVAKRLTVVIDPDKVKIDLKDPWGVMEVQAIRSKLNDQLRDLTVAQERAKQMDGFISKWMEEWKLPHSDTKSDQVVLEEEMGGYLGSIQARDDFRESIEECVGVFPSDKPLLEAHKAIREQINILTKENSQLTAKLNDAKAPKGYKVWKTYKPIGLIIKVYKKEVTS